MGSKKGRKQGEGQREKAKLKKKREGNEGKQGAILLVFFLAVC